MKAAIFKGPGDIEVGERPDPAILEPTDAVVRVVLACVCGSDLWRYRGVKPVPRPTAIGHEFIGTVESVGNAVTTLAVGDLVIVTKFIDVPPQVAAISPFVRSTVMLPSKAARSVKRCSGTR